MNNFEKKCLIVDDNDINRLVIEMILQSFDFIVDNANNGKVAIELIDKNKYSIIFMDIKMPIVDGIACTKKLRSSNCETIIIGLTGHADIETHKIGINAGMNDILTKPITSGNIKNILNKYNLM